MRNYIREHKWQGIAITLLMVVSILGSMLTVDRIKQGNKTKTIITIGSQVSASTTADYIATGSAAAQTSIFQSAINALPASGGILNILSGTFTLTSSITRAIANVTIEGIGNSTIFADNGVTPIFTSGGNGWSFENFATDAGGISTGSYSYFTVGVYVNGTQLAIINPTGRTGYGIAASDASATEKAQADRVCTGTVSTGNDATIINAAITALNALGGTQSLTLIGDFYCTQQINGLSNVNVECNGTITVNAADGSNAIYLQGVTNSVWTTVKAYRTGTSNNHSYTTGGCWVLIGACNRTLVLNHCEGYNQTTDAGYVSAGLTMAGSAGICSATVLGGYYQGGGTTAGTQNAGIVISLQLQGSPLLDSVYAKGGSGGWSSGIIWEEETTGEIIGGVYKGGTGNGCCGGFFDNASGGIVSGATFIGGDAGTQCEGVQTYGNNTTAFNGCTIEAGKPYLTSLNSGMSCDQSSAPIVTGGSISLQSQGFVWDYTVANNGRFQPLPAGYIPRIVSLQIYVITGTSGATLDIGHSPAEGDVAHGIDISATGTSPVFTLQRDGGDANGYFYLTPNKSIPEGSIKVYVTCLYDDIGGSTYSPAVIMETTGYARFIGVDMLSASVCGTLFINDVTHKNWSMTGCQIENMYSNTIEASAAITNVPVYLSTIKGLISANIISFAAGTPAGTNIQY